MIELQSICKYYNPNKQAALTRALDGVDLTISEGELVAITGKSGSGKSTLINIIGGLDTPTSGSYFFRKQNILKLSSDKLAEFRNKTVGIVVQNPVLMNEISVLENVELPLIIAGRKTAECEKLAKDALFDVGLENLILRKVYTLSGGEQQRVSIARAVVNNPDIIIADEPTGSLDSENAAKIINILKQINNSGKTVIIVTHDMDIAAECNRLIVLKDGKIV
ncbi:MAG: ABC transporter ATP-binding protein [Clostridia bacterium]